jgi:hypothetical protein
MWRGTVPVQMQDWFQASEGPLQNAFRNPMTGRDIPPLEDLREVELTWSYA